jgi:organic hydroperoxide reductase OsmC/OhrA
MKISSLVSNTRTQHNVEVETSGRRQKIEIAPKNAGRGSSINGGELLLTALATCFCNDLYREAEKRNIDVEGVQVEATATFGGPGEPASDISYRVRVNANATEGMIVDLIQATDRMTEIQNTVRKGCAVRLVFE